MPFDPAVRLAELRSRKRRRIEQLRAQAAAAPPDSSFGDWAISTGLRVVPSIVGGLGGAALGAAGTLGIGAVPAGIAGGAAGGGFGEWLAQEYEKARGLRKDLSAGGIALEAGLGAIPLGKSATMARAAAKGAGMSAAGTVGHSLIDRGEMPSATELAVSTGLGGAFGAGGEWAFNKLFPGRPAPSGKATDIPTPTDTGEMQGPLIAGHYPETVRYLPADIGAAQRRSRDVEEALARHEWQYEDALRDVDESLTGFSNWREDMAAQETADAMRRQSDLEAMKAGLGAETERRNSLMYQLRDMARRQAIAAEEEEAARHLRRREAAYQTRLNEERAAREQAQLIEIARSERRRAAGRESAAWEAADQAAVEAGTRRQQQLAALREVAASARRREAGRLTMLKQGFNEIWEMLGGDPPPPPRAPMGPEGGAPPTLPGVPAVGDWRMAPGGEPPPLTLRGEQLEPEPPPRFPWDEEPPDAAGGVPPPAGPGPQPPPFDTGGQARLPGSVGGVRDVEVPAAEFDLPTQEPPPFDLTNPVVPQSGLRTLFGIPEEAPHTPVVDVPGQQVRGRLDLPEPEPPPEPIAAAGAAAPPPPTRGDVEARLARVKDLSDDELEQLKDDLHDVDSHLGEDPDRRAWQLKTLRAIHDEQGRREPPTTYAADSETDRGWFRTHYVNRAAFKEALEKERANPKANPKRLAELQERVDDFEEIVAEDIATFGERHGDDWIQESIAEAEAEIAKRAKGGRGGTSRITPPDEDFDEPPAGLVKIAEVKPAPKTPKQKLADTLGVPKPQKYSVVNKHTGQTLGEVEADTQRKALLKARKQFPHGDSIAVVPKRDEPPPPAAAAPRKGKPPGKPPAPPSTVAVLKPGAYRGYLIRQHEVDGSVWIEKDGHMILRDAKSIENARRQIDELIDGPPAPPPTPLQKLGEKLGIRKPRKPRKGTVEAAEREAIESGRKGVKRGSEEFPFSQDNPEGLTGRKLEALRRKQDAARRAEQAKADKEIAADLEREGNDYGSRQLLEDVAAMGGLRIVPKKPKKHWTQLPGGGPKRLEESGEIERLMEARPTMAQKYKNKKRGWGIWTSKTFDKVQPDVLGGVKGVFATEGKTPSELAEGLRGLGWRIESGDQLLAMMETANNNLSGLFKRKRPLWDKPVYGKDVDDILGNRRGEISAELVSAVAGGAGGALVGGTQGDTTQERIQYALLGGLAGAGGSAALARFLGSRMASRAAQAAAGSQAKAGTTVEHRVPGPQGTFDTAPGMNRTPSRGTKTVTPTGTYSEGGPSGRVNVKTKEARRAAENEVIRFMGGDVPAARRMPKAQREELGFERFPEEQRDGIEDLVVESLGQGNYERGLDVLEAHRRGRQPNVRTKALGAEMALSTKDKLAPGFNMAASGHSAYMDAVASTQDDIRQVARKIKDTGGTDADLLELHQLKQRWSVLFLNYMGLRSEAGRALQIYKAGARIMPHEFRLVRELLDRGRLRKDTIDFADIMTNLSDDPVKAFQELRKHEQRGLMARIGDYYMSNILSGIKTQERNFLGNASRLVSRLAVKLGTGGLDALQSLLTGSERQVYSKEVLHELQGGFAGAQKAWEDFTETLKYGFSPTAIREGLQNTEGPVYLPKTEMPGGGRNPLNYPGRLLEAADRLFRNLNGSMELYGLTYQAARKHAEREGLEGTAFTNRVADLMTGMRANPSGELKAIIAKAAERAVFQEDPGTAANLLISLKKVVPPLQYVIPFVRTVSNIMKQGAEHTPVGFLMKRARQSDDLREQTIARGEAAMGTLAMLPIAYYAATGNISGSGPKDPAKRAALYEEGWRPNSVRIGNRWVSYTLAQPFSVPLSIIANGFEAWQEASQDATEKTKAEKLESIAAQTMLRVGKSALDQSFLSGLGDLVKAINDPERASSGFFARVASGFVPLSGLQRNVAQFIDPTVRQPEGVIETLKTGIPGASFTVQPRLTRFGEAAQRERQSAVVVPEMTPVTTDPVALELSRLGLDIGLPTDRINFSEMAPGARQLTGDESFTLRQTRGRATRVILDSVMNMPGYKGLPDVLKAELLRRALRDQMGDVNDVARIALQGGRPDLLQNLSAPLESLAASTYRETR